MRDQKGISSLNSGAACSTGAGLGAGFGGALIVRPSADFVLGWWVMIFSTITLSPWRSAPSLPVQLASLPTPATAKPSPACKLSHSACADSEKAISDTTVSPCLSLDLSAPVT